MIVVDVETTGIYPEKNSIVSIGAVDFKNPENQFYQECRIWEGAEISYEALAVNGFTREQVLHENKNSLEETIKSFVKWMEKIDNQTFAGHNVWFDVGFLRDGLKRAKLSNSNYTLEAKFGSRTIDLHSECYTNHLKRELIPPQKNGRTNLNLDKTLVYVGLPEEPKPHNALTGAKMEAEAFSRLIYGKELFKEFEIYSIPSPLYWAL